MNDITVRLQHATATLEDLRAVLEDEEELELVLNRLARTVSGAVPAATAVSVTVLADEGQSAWTAAATDAAVLAIDKVQYVTGHGPCLQAAHTRRPVRVGVEEIRNRWPAFADAAGKAGMWAYLSAPLLLGDEPAIGALNLYGQSPDAFDRIDEALLGLFTTAASAAIVNARRYLRARDLAFQMKTAMDSRAEIEQAKGALMAQHAITADEAFEHLVHRSQDTNTKLREIARAILTSLQQTRQSS
jgi:GAF domain-containing protein